MKMFARRAIESKEFVQDEEISQLRFSKRLQDQKNPKFVLYEEHSAGTCFANMLLRSGIVK